MMALSKRLSITTQSRNRKTLLSRVFLFLSVGRERNALANLEPHMLDDIGVSETQARTESTRPAWDAPSRWMS